YNQGNPTVPLTQRSQVRQRQIFSSRMCYNTSASQAVWWPVAHPRLDRTLGQANLQSAATQQDGAGGRNVRSKAQCGQMLHASAHQPSYAEYFVGSQLKIC